MCPRPILNPTINRSMTLTDDHIEPGIEPVQFNLTFKIVQTATRKCKDALVDSAGYSYNVKRNTKTGRDWQCVFRGSGTTSCPASVKQDAVNNVFMSAGTIVEQAIATHADEVQTHFSRPKVENLIRMANRAREQLRPNEPDSMDFQIAENYIPQGFLRKDITTEDG
ncbi:hypothetical protein KUTeg_011604 [Tegillarca granosa]|uniref:FLYWCH-type domain-containing protein n=1 Tax=Tegillarca granosa TaxID=220873 RepID=A0ABQ9EX40_TEGGR|nr:hypothetical protein KUTeg_011604 [Tegillarca granosa]